MFKIILATSILLASAALQANAAETYFFRQNANPIAFRADGPPVVVEPPAELQIDISLLVPTGQAYLEEFFTLTAPTVSNAVGAVTFTATGLSETGLSIDPATGVVSGTPEREGAVNLSVKATDSTGKSDEESLSFAVHPSRAKKMFLQSEGIARGAVGVAYAESLERFLSLQNIPMADVTWSLANLPTQSLPSGITLSNGTLSGTPTAVGEYSFTVKTSFDDAGTPIEDSDLFELIIRNRNFAQITLGWYHACGITDAGGVQCWGYNNNAQLGTGDTSNRNVPTNVVGLDSGVVELSGGSGHTCALKDSGQVLCWGSQASGQLGNGLTAGRATTPVVASLVGSDFASIGAGNSSTCGLTTSGGVKCWGANTYGQLGNGTFTSSPTPVTPTGLGSGVRALSVGSLTACVVMVDGSAKCWGANSRGQVGDSTTTHRNQPVEVLASGVQKILTNGYNLDWGNTCALMAGGTVKCWGRNTNGSLGDGTYVNRLSPVNVLNISGAKDIAVAVAHSCAHMADNSLTCWGENGEGRVGDGTNTTRNVPTKVLNAENIEDLTAGGDSACAISKGNSKCWGGNTYGQLGVGDQGHRNIPVAVQ